MRNKTESKQEIEFMYEKIVSFLTNRNIHINKHLLFIMFLFLWICTGCLTVVIYGKWLYEPILRLLLTSLGIIFLYVIIHIEKNTIFKSYFINNEYGHLFRFIQTFFLVLMISWQIFWMLKEWWEIHNNPQIIGNSIYSGGNMGFFAVGYVAMISIPLFLVFVDFVSFILFAIVSVMLNIRKFKYNINTEDICGGGSELAKLISHTYWIYFGVITYFSIVRIRFIGNEANNFVSYFFLLTIAWTLGLLTYLIIKHYLKKKIISSFNIFYHNTINKQDIELKNTPLRIFSLLSRQIILVDYCQKILGDKFKYISFGVSIVINILNLLISGNTQIHNLWNSFINIMGSLVRL